MRSLVLRQPELPSESLDDIADADLAHRGGAQHGQHERLEVWDRHQRALKAPATARNRSSAV